MCVNDVYTKCTVIFVTVCNCLKYTCKCNNYICFEYCKIVHQRYSLPLVEFSILTYMYFEMKIRFPIL